MPLSFDHNRHQLVVAINHFGALTKLGEIDLSDVDPTDEDAPHSLAEQVTVILHAFYAKQRDELAEKEWIIQPQFVPEAVTEKEALLEFLRACRHDLLLLERGEAAQIEYEIKRA